MAHFAWASDRRAAVVAASVTLLACVAVVYATPADSYWIVDCGNKAQLAHRLLETRYGDLNFEHPAREVDPEAIAFPMRGGFSIRRGEGFASRFPPAYPALSVPFLAVLGPAGLRIPAALGVAACAALLTLWLAPCVGRGWGLVGGLCVGLATPLFFYGATVWEHSITVALCLAAWLAAARLTWKGLLCAGFLIGVACWFREEVALMGATLAAACYLRTRSLSGPAALAVGAAAPLGLLLLFNQIAYDNILGPHLPGISNMATPAGSAVELLRQAASMIVGYGPSAAEAALLGLLSLVALASGALAARRGAGLGVGIAACVLVGLGIWLYGATRIRFGEDSLAQLVLYNGLMAHMPMLCLAGAGLVDVWRLPEYARLRIGVAAGVGFLLLAAAFALLSQSGVFGVHWGQRWLLPAVPAIVALAVVAVKELSRASRGWLACWLPLIAAGLASSALSVWLLAHQKLDAQRLESAVLALPARYVVTTHPFLGEHLASLWHRKPLLFVGSSEALTHVVRGLRSHGVREFLILRSPEEPGVAIGGWTCRTVRRHSGRLRYLDFDMNLCTLQRPRGRPRLHNPS